jgi:hypothetical protein
MSNAVQWHRSCQGQRKLAARPVSELPAHVSGAACGLSAQPSTNHTAASPPTVRAPPPLACRQAARALRPQVSRLRRCCRAPAAPSAAAPAAPPAAPPLAPAPPPPPRAAAPAATPPRRRAAPAACPPAPAASGRGRGLVGATARQQAAPGLAGVQAGPGHQGSTSCTSRYRPSTPPSLTTHLLPAALALALLLLELLLQLLLERLTALQLSRQLRLQPRCRGLQLLNHLQRWQQQAWTSRLGGSGHQLPARGRAGTRWLASEHRPRTLSAAATCSASCSAASCLSDSSSSAWACCSAAAWSCAAGRA